MDRTEIAALIAALAEGMVPFVREVVTDALTTLSGRMAELEARPIEKGDRGADGLPGPEGPPGPKGDNGELSPLPAELAEQVALAVRMLHESPAIQREAPRPSKVTRIERDEDGNFVTVYDDHAV